MFFRTEPFPIRTDLDGSTYYGRVNNRVIVSSVKGVTSNAYIEIPAALFHFFDSVPTMKRGLADAGTIVFRLNENTSKQWVLSVVFDDAAYDLWPYSKKPVWATAHRLV